jgi:hypothetical protein
MFNRLLSNSTQNNKKETSEEQTKSLDSLIDAASLLDKEDMINIKGGESNNQQTHLNHFELRDIPGGNTPS